MDYMSAIDGDDSGDLIDLTTADDSYSSSSSYSDAL